MKHKTIGFIGCGNMGSAMVSGIVSSGLCPPDDIIASAHTQKTLDRLSAEYGIQVTDDNKEVVQNSDLIFLAVKPYLYKDVIEEIRDFVDDGIIRAMPNTPAMVLEAMTAFTPNEYISEEELNYVSSIFESFGKSEAVPESLMDAVIGVSGSSPAYVYIMIEAMADAAVADGMPRVQAYKFAAQAVYGAAKMVLETGMHPGVLKDAVCSPGGTTIAAVAKLEETGMRNAVIRAQRCCVAKAKEMSKK